MESPRLPVILVRSGESERAGTVASSSEEIESARGDGGIKVMRRATVSKTTKLPSLSKDAFLAGLSTSRDTPPSIGTTRLMFLARSSARARKYTERASAEIRGRCALRVPGITVAES